MKRTLSLLLVLVLVLSMFTACGGTDEKNDTSKTVETKDVWDYSSISVFKDDPMFPDGCVFYSDLMKLWGREVPLPDGEVKIGYVGKSLENEYWQMVIKGLNDEVDKMKAAGFDVTLDARAAQNENDTEGQLSIMYDMINKGYDILIIAPITDSNLNPGVEAAQQAGIPVIPQSVIFDKDPKLPYYVGVSAYTEGQIAAKKMADLVGPDGGNVAIITGIPNNTAAIGRTSGFSDYFSAHPELKITVASTQNADWDRMKALDITSNLLKQYPDLKGVYCNNDTMAMGALEAVKTAGKSGKVYIGGTDATSEAVASINAGELDYTVNNFPYYFGTMAMEMAFRVLNGENIPERVICFEGLLDKSNTSTDNAEAAGWTDYKYVKASEYTPGN